VDRATQQIVKPRWKTSCGRNIGPIQFPANAPASGTADASTHADAAGPVLLPENFADSGAGGEGWQWYYDCRQPRFMDASAWLDGPVCALEFETETFRGCAPLTDLSKAGN